MRGVHHRRTVVRAFTLLLAATFVSPLWAAPGDITQVAAPVLGSDPPAARPLGDGDASVSTQTGALTYSYPITVPAGRNGMQPSLALTYSSQSPIYGGVAAGWSLSLPEIHLDTSTSVLAQRYLGGSILDPDAWKRLRFVSTLAGGRPLVPVAEPGASDVLATYRAQNDSTYARYERMADSAPYRWRVRSTDGVVRYFGDASLAPGSHALWTPLTREIDAYGNTVEYQWDGADVALIRYTSNPSTGQPHFAEVEFERDASYCIQSVGQQPDARLGIIRGAAALRKIRIRALAGATTVHTRELTLAYDVDREACGLRHAPVRALASIQESAWGVTSPRVDLPPVTFDYNRYHRTLDEAHTVPAADLWADDSLRNNLSWGIRRPTEWPSIEGMLLDFDGDGLQDRLYAVHDGDECKFTWRRNLGRQADGNIRFGDSGIAPQALPRLPWDLGAKGNTEWCSLSAQLTTQTNVTAENAACPSTTGTYLAYRWLDMNEDGRPDLVTAIHHDPRWFDPNAEAWFGPWPSCTGEGEGDCPELESACMDEALACFVDEPCTLDGDDVAACVAGASTSACDTRIAARAGAVTQSCFDSCMEQNWVATQAECAAFPTQCQERCTDLCSSRDTLEPTGPGGGGIDLSCDAKVPHRRCDGRYPWMVYENLGGYLATTPQIKYQPVPLESDSGDSSFGGGALSSTRHGIQDLDGDGDLDAIVRDRSVTDGGSMHWWQVFLGDGHGNFAPFADNHPYIWPVPPRAPVSLSCSSQPGATCTAIAVASVQSDNFDVRGLATLTDLDGDGVSDLVWKHASNQFDETQARPPVFRAVPDSAPLQVFPNNGRQFLYWNGPAAPSGNRLDLAAPGLQHVSRSFYDSTANIGVFSTTGTRTSMSRLLDLDMDGRPDLIEAGRVGGVWEDPALYINVGGYFYPGVEIDPTLRARLEQRTDAAPTNFGDPKRAYGWQSTKDLTDLDGDGLPEAWDFTGGSATYYTDSDDQPLRLLKRIDNGRGAATEITYAPTTDTDVVLQDAATRRAMPKIQWVVSSIATTDAWDPDVSTTAYHYDYPVWRQDDEQRWDFRGFEKVTTTLPSGARQIDEYGYVPDWSGRLVKSSLWSTEDLAGPRTITETTWESRSLFAATLWTFHPTITRTWACRNGQTEAQCKAAGSGAGFTKKASVWAAVAGVTGPPRAFVEQETYTMDGEVFDNGDRRTFEGYTLYADPTHYQLKPSVHAALTLVGGVHTWVDYQTWEYDADYRHVVRDSKYLSLTGAGSPDVATRAITAWEYEPSGVLKTRQQPKHFPSGPKEHYGYDATQRFVTSTTDELGHVVTADFEPGTGAERWTRGPNSASCGASCTNFEQTWTDVDGLGRPLVSYVNRGADGVPWTKTRVAVTTYTDAIVGGARPHIVAEALIDYDTAPARWTREETRLDGRGRPRELIVRTGGSIDAISTYDYDARGHLVAVTLPDPSVDSAATVTYTYSFDSLGRPTGMRRPAVDGAVGGVDLAYDGLVHTSAEVATGTASGPLARKDLVHDAFDRLVEVREYTAPTTYASTTYTYDARDAVTRIQNPDGVVTDLFHDLGGRRTRIERAGRTWTYTYWPDGQVATETVPGPAGTSTTSFAYDAIGRPSSRVVASRGLSSGDLALFGIGTVTFTHDACTNGVGRLCAVTYPGTLATSYAYDAEGNAVAESRTYDFAGLTGTRATTASFGPGGRIVRQTYPDHAEGDTARTEARFTYDDRAKPASVAWVAPGAAPRTVAAQTRNVAGLVTARTAPLAGVATGWRSFASDWTYDPLGRVTSQIISDSTSTQHAAQELDYHTLDDPKALRHWLAATTYELAFAYDPRHQLTGVTEATGKLTASYGFTPGGKLSTSHVAATAAPGLNRTVGHAYASPVDPEAPSALTVAGGPNLRSYTYDSPGNLVAVRAGNPTSDPTDTFLYDGEDQLRRATKWSGTTVTGTEEYFYDHAGQRVAVVTRDATNAVTGARLFLGDAELELSPTGELGTVFSHLSLGTPVARVESPKGGWTSGASTTLATRLELQYHGLSSNTLVSLRPDGTVDAGFVYTPYGELLETTGAAPASQHRRFNDKFRDDLTGLTYYGVRYYDALSLSWTQADPLFRFAPDAAWSEPRRANLYTFVAGNPLRYIDPDGRDLRDVVRIFGGSITELEIDTGKTMWDVYKGRASGETGARKFGANKVRAVGLLADAYSKTPFPGWAAGIIADEIEDNQRPFSIDELLNSRIEAFTPGDSPSKPKGAVREIHDSEVVVRGGTGDLPEPGSWFSGAVGKDLDDAAQGVVHGQVRATTAGEIRAANGMVVHAPEPGYPGGPINPKHVHVCLPHGNCFGPLIKNPVPKAERVPGPPKKK